MPYFDSSSATGLAFESATDKTPKSLQYIYKACEHDGYENPSISRWESQGVFLLNTALTVEKGKANSHKQFWQDFTKRVVNYISMANEDVIWLMWGKQAQTYIPYINPSSKNVLPILTAPHPAAEAYSGGKAGFITCKHFSKTNEILANKQVAKIMW